MPEMPDFIRKAIEAQGKFAPEEIEERLDEADTLLGVVEPEPQVEEAPEVDPNQTSIFDPAAGAAGKEEGMARADRAAAPDWKARAWDAILELVGRGSEFTADDVWEIVGYGTHERRALGPLLTKAAKRGMIEKTGEQRNSQRPEHHAYPCTVWKVTV